jgi:hypothetical protein
LITPLASVHSGSSNQPKKEKRERFG